MPPGRSLSFPSNINFRESLPGIPLIFSSQPIHRLLNGLCSCHLSSSYSSNLPCRSYSKRAEHGHTNAHADQTNRQQTPLFPFHVSTSPHKCMSPRLSPCHNFPTLFSAEEKLTVRTLFSLCFLLLFGPFFCIINIYPLRMFFIYPFCTYLYVANCAFFQK